jgi:hypothetical protein
VAKKNKVKMHCQICNKTTVHEVRTIDGQESCVCLTCEGTRKAAENAAIRFEDRYHANKFETERAIEAERTRTMSPGG